jgi:hypothetical protein
LLSKIPNSGKRHCFLYVNRENEAEKFFPELEGSKNNEIYFEK